VPLIIEGWNPEVLEPLVSLTGGDAEPLKDGLYPEGDAVATETLASLIGDDEHVEGTEWTNAICDSK
jgi:hypothetical protein